MEREELLNLQRKQIQIQADTIQGQLLEITKLCKKNTCLLKKIGELEEELQREKAKDEMERDRLLKEMRKKEEKVATKERVQEEAIRQLGDEINLRRAKEKELEDKIQQMENSKSWKLTAPLRGLLWKLKRKEE